MGQRKGRVLVWDLSELSDASNVGRKIAFNLKLKRNSPASSGQKKTYSIGLPSSAGQTAGPHPGSQAWPLQQFGTPSQTQPPLACLQICVDWLGHPRESLSGKVGQG